MFIYYTSFASVIAAATAIRMDPNWYQNSAGKHFKTEESFYNALAANQENGKFTLIDFFMKGCGWCFKF